MVRVTGSRTGWRDALAPDHLDAKTLELAANRVDRVDGRDPASVGTPVGLPALW